MGAEATIAVWPTDKKSSPLLEMQPNLIAARRMPETMAIHVLLTANQRAMRHLDWRTTLHANSVATAFDRRC